jgi:photosystem II stability/assembly factor-like uncharacterized protein
MKTFIFAIIIGLMTHVIVFGQWTALNPGTTLNLSVINQNPSGSVFISSTGYPGLIIKSDDSGTTWYNVANNVNGFSDIIFLTGNTGLAIPKSQDTIFKSHDGGNTWQQQYSLNCYGPSRGFPDVHFTDSLTGYAPGYKTTDGGDSWFLQFQSVTSFPYVPEAINFINDSTGIIAGYEYWGAMAKTMDYGNSWNWVVVPYQTWEIYAIHFPFETIGYAASYQISGGLYSAEILKTADAGNTWTNINVFAGGPFGNKGFHLWSVYCVDTNICYAVGDSGKIAMTMDGGLTWNFQNSGTTQTLRKIFFTDANTGYIVGDSGTVLKTVNGGGVSINSIDSQPTFISVFPNPSNNSLNLQTNSVNSFQFTLYNSDGKTILEKSIKGSDTKIDISACSSGMYYYNLVFADGKRKTGKVVITN